jgi:hypothetical protein
MNNEKDKCATRDKAASRQDKKDERVFLSPEGHLSILSAAKQQLITKHYQL